MSILLLLQTHGRLSAAELAGRLEVSVRTIMRDVDALSASGVPVYTERGRTGGIALLPGYRTDVTGLTTDEARALFVLVTDRAHTDLGLGSALGSALRKVMAALPAAYRPDADLASRRILIDPTRWRGGPQRSPAELAIVQRAVFTDRRLRLRYRHGRDSRVRSYTLDPYGLVNKTGVWYLVADHCGHPKLFRLDRIASAAILDEPVQRRGGLELPEVWDGLRRYIDEFPTPLKVRVRVRREALARFLRFHAADLAEPPPILVDDLGSGADPAPEHVEIRLQFHALVASEALLAFGTDVEVLEPADVRHALAHKAAEITDLYPRQS
ncbi:WYL domain-containing protein [Nocardia sp. JMUB6875]